MWPSSAVIKWCAKNGEMSLKTFQGSDSIARTSYCCQMFPEWKLIPRSTGKWESPYIHQKEEREVPWSQSFPLCPHWASARGTDPGNGFLKKYVSLLPFPLCLAENRQVSHTWPWFWIWIISGHQLLLPTARNQWDFTDWCRSLSQRVMMWDQSFCLQFLHA